MVYYFYILFSEEMDRYYIGYTSESLDNRLRRHNSNHNGLTGSSHWKLVYTESYPTKLQKALSKKINFFIHLYD